MPAQSECSGHVMHAVPLVCRKVPALHAHRGGATPDVHSEQLCARAVSVVAAHAPFCRAYSDAQSAAACGTHAAPTATATSML